MCVATGDAGWKPDHISCRTAWTSLAACKTKTKPPPPPPRLLLLLLLPQSRHCDAISLISVTRASTITSITRAGCFAVALELDLIA